MRNEFMIERNGKAFCLYAGLLDQAHQEGLKRITTTLLQPPTADNGMVAIVSAEVETERGIFSGLGDASPANVSRAMQVCLIRMAETRAKARALRDAVNVSACSLEELGDEPGQTGHPLTIEPPPVPSVPVHRPAERPSAPTAPVVADSPNAPATPAQRRMLSALAERLGESFEADSLTRLQASRLITELKGRVSSRAA